MGNKQNKWSLSEFKSSLDFPDEGDGGRGSERCRNIELSHNVFVRISDCPFIYDLVHVLLS